MEKITIKHSVLMELLKNIHGETIIDEALKMGEIDIIDDLSGKKVGKISIKK